MKFHFKAALINGEPGMDFGSDYNRIRYKNWLRGNIGKYGSVEPREKISKEARGYFEGALCPSYVEWKGGDPHDSVEIMKIREVFKLEFNGEVVEGLNGEPIKIALSTTKLSRQEFRAYFVAKITEYFEEQEIPIPNPDLYKMWDKKWKDRYPLLSFWQFLKKFNIRSDSRVEEATNYVPRDERKMVDYPKENKKITAF